MKCVWTAPRVQFDPGFSVGIIGASITLSPKALTFSCIRMPSACYTYATCLQWCYCYGPLCVQYQCTDSTKAFPHLQPHFHKTKLPGNFHDMLTCLDLPSSSSCVLASCSHVVPSEHHTCAEAKGQVIVC